MATFNEIDRLAKPAVAWFYAVAKELGDKVYAEPDRFEREFTARSADWDRALAMYNDSAAHLQPAARDRFAVYVTMAAEHRPRVAALLKGAHAAARERAARLECRDISGVIDGFGNVCSDADPGL